MSTRWRFWTTTRGAIEVLAPDADRAWSRFVDAGYDPGTVLGAPTPMGEAGRAVTLTEVLSTVRGGEGTR